MPGLHMTDALLESNFRPGFSGDINVVHKTKLTKLKYPTRRSFYAKLKDAFPKNDFRF